MNGFTRTNALARPERPRSGSNTREFVSKDNIMVVVDEYVFKDADKDPEDRMSYPNEDFVWAFLKTESPYLAEKGIVPTFSEPDSDGIQHPTTRIKLMLPADANTPARRHSLLDFSVAKSNRPSMPKGSEIMFEKVTLRDDGVVVAPFAHVCASKKQIDQGLRVVFSDMLVQVRPERSYKDAETGEIKPTGKQDVLIADPKGAVLVTSKDYFKELVNSVVAETGLGNPGFHLLARRLAPEGATDEEKAAIAADPNSRIGVIGVAKTRKVPELDGNGKETGQEVYVRDTADEVYNNFVGIQSNAALVNAIGNPDWQFEFVPMMTLGQASSAVPSKAKADNKKGDASLLYGIYGKVTPELERTARNIITAPDGVKHGMVNVGWMPTHIVCDRKTPQTQAWYSTYQSPMATGSVVDDGNDIRTPLTPDYHLKAIEAEAAKNVSAKSAYFGARTAVKRAAEAEAGPQAAPTRR